MEAKMSLKAKKELLKNVYNRYQKASWKQKGKILDEFVEATGYHRKYALQLLHAPENSPSILRLPRKSSSRYTPEVVEALVAVWNVANQICSKRLIAVLPDFLSALEGAGCLVVAEETRAHLLRMSAATIDRLLSPERKKIGRGRSTTRAGKLLKKQIPVRTFAEWNDVLPGFVEADLVAHCGETTAGTYLNTLTLTDVASGWTECLPLLHKNEINVREALHYARKSLFPIPLLGLDTDNGSEFINNGLLSYCQSEKITFTRSRPYKKNDQAHVEEKNGSIVRKMVGYDRYEGSRPYVALAEFYARLRLYVNFFQPSMKLLSKERDGAKVKKKYDRARTPYQRLEQSSAVSLEDKAQLKAQYESLNVITLFAEIQKLQDELWSHAWKKGMDSSSPEEICALTLLAPIQQPITKRQYRKSGKPRKKSEPRTWCTHSDVFESVAGEIHQMLTAEPARAATSILEELQKRHPGQFEDKLKRTLQRRVKDWREKNGSPTLPKLSDVLPARAVNAACRTTRSQPAV